MGNENRSDQAWKKLLEDEVALSGELMQDKAAAWKVVHHRLHLQSRRKRLTGYWVAAASLLLVIAIPFTFLQDNKRSLVKEAAPKKHMYVLPKQAYTAKQATAISETVPVEHSAKKEVVKSRIKYSISKLTVSDDSGWVINREEANREISSLPPLVVDSPSATVVAVVPLKKQWKVVHVNELGDSLFASPAWTHHTEQHSFELQIGKEEVVTNTAVNVDKPAFALIKIKTSPTN
jgi:hypothetical protein